MVRWRPIVPVLALGAVCLAAPVAAAGKASGLKPRPFSLALLVGLKPHPDTELQQRIRVAGQPHLSTQMLLGGQVDPAAQTVPEDRNPPVEYKALPDARSKANEILARREFRRVEENPFWEQQMAKVAMYLNRMTSSIGEMIPQVPWFATALEWGVLALAAVGLVIWVLRASKQQRVAIAQGGRRSDEWERESDNWAERAREEAGRGEWREAVHCLYWSAIVLLEGQKMWRQNRARTPREYVVLLEAGSTKQQALGGLTRVFERIWYGLRPAAESDYRQASAMLEDLRAR